MLSSGLMSRSELKLKFKVLRLGKRRPKSTGNSSRPTDVSSRCCRLRRLCERRRFGNVFPDRRIVRASSGSSKSVMRASSGSTCLRMDSRIRSARLAMPPTVVRALSSTFSVRNFGNIETSRCERPQARNDKYSNFDIRPRTFRPPSSRSLSNLKLSNAVRSSKPSTRQDQSYTATILKKLEQCVDISIKNN